jgi:hypothetical protein
VATTLPDGRVLNMLVYGSGHVHQFNIDGQVISDIERDALHRETARTQGQLRSLSQYDSMGRLGMARPSSAATVHAAGQLSRMQEACSMTPPTAPTKNALNCWVRTAGPQGIQAGV